MAKLTRREALQIGVVGLGTASLAAADESPGGASFHYDHILGTSLDAWLVASPDAAARAEAIALAEFDRLNAIFSVHDRESELSRLNRSSGSVAVSREIVEVLREYERWFAITGGALNPAVGSLIQVWEEAVARDEYPDPLDLSQRRYWSLSGNVVHRSANVIFNLNSIAKGYILQRVCDAVAAIPGVQAGLINLGGDLHAWGDIDWQVEVQDPHAPAENAAPLTSLRLRNASAATSGSYQRHFAIRGHQHSHILDPRSGWPADDIAGVTVIAPDSTTANAAATALCVLGADGLRRIGNVEALIVDAKGAQTRSPQFARYEIPQPKIRIPAQPTAADADWPADFEVKVSLELPTIAGGKYRRPYVAVWIEDAAGKVVRSVQVWGNERRWLATLAGWWKIGKASDTLVKAVTRATRGPGKYDVIWDGKDDAGMPLPQGTYTIKLEVHREHGRNTLQTGKINCQTSTATVKMAANAEAGPTTVTYAKKAKK